MGVSVFTSRNAAQFIFAEHEHRTVTAKQQAQCFVMRNEQEIIRRVDQYFQWEGGSFSFR